MADLSAAVGDEDFRGVQWLLQQPGTDVNAVNDPCSRETALHQAACMGNVLILALILQTAGVDVNPSDGLGHVPLHCACENSPTATQVVENLLEAGGSPNIPNNVRANNVGETLLHHAVRDCQIGLVKVLLNGRANPQVEEYQNHTPLHFACCNGWNEIARLLLQHCGESQLAYLTRQNNNQKTALDALPRQGIQEAFLGHTSTVLLQ